MSLKKNLANLMLEVVIPAYVASNIACTALLGGYAFGEYVNITIGDRSGPYIWCVNATEQEIDSDGDGTLDTRVIVIPGGGIIRETLEE